MNLKTLTDQLWFRGNLKYKLWDQQVSIYDAIYALPKEIDEAVVLCARQFGKSHLGVLIAIEQCLRWKDKCFLILGPTLKQTREIVTPRLRHIIADAPEGLIRPSKSEGKWYIGSSELVMGGFDLNTGSQRGKTLQGVFVEEIVDANPDQYLESLRSDVGPALTHSDGGKIIFLTTLPKIPDHPFITETMSRAQMNNAFYSFTIDDNKALSHSQYEACIRRAGGRHTDDFKREYLNEIIRDKSIVVVPDFDIDRHVADVQVPDTCNWEIYIDWGGVRDLTVPQLWDMTSCKESISWLMNYGGQPTRQPRILYEISDENGAGSGYSLINPSTSIMPTCQDNLPLTWAVLLE